MNRNTLQTGIEQLIACDGVVGVELFGTEAQGKTRTDSDLDLAVICRKPALSRAQHCELWRA